MHIGTFTPEGTWKAASRLLPHLAETGITLLEIMPVADFAGGFGWGYDGVNMFARRGSTARRTISALSSIVRIKWV
jgi:maltooligosyltrehalose trehalohydrolase